MFDKLEDLLVRLEEILSELNEPGVANDPARFQKLMKEQSELQPIVDAYKEYKACQQTVEESLMMLDEESDEEMREMLKEELADVIVYSQNLLDKLGLDADEIVNMKMGMNEKKYPVEKARGKSAKYDQL
jgi:protein subunit release factor A